MSRGDVDGTGERIVAKKQKLSNGTHKERSSLRIFTPFRVCKPILLASLLTLIASLLDHRSCVSYFRSFYLHSTRQNHLPSHDLRGKMPSYVRPG